MKKILLLIVVSAMILVSCSDEWDKHYDGNVIDQNVSSLTLKEYFDSEDSYSDFYALLKSAGIADELGKNQFLTIWAVKNENYDASEFQNMSDTLLGGYHACNLAFSSSELKDGLRILCMNGIYVTISQKEDAGFYVNKSQILSSRRFKNGVVHEVSSLMRPLINMFEYVKTLSDDYSIIRDSIIMYNERVFDQANSIPKGVDISGNVIYDSAFVDWNDLFKKLAINSEFDQFTMFVPSNEVIWDCIAKMRKQYELMNWEYTAKDSLLAMKWIKETTIHEGIINNYHATLDLKSSYHVTADKVRILRVWRTSVQEVDEVNVDELSNGLAYKVTKMKIPNNVLIDRIKSYVYYYQYLTPEEKANLYIGKGINYEVAGGVGIEPAGADGDPIGGQYRILKVHGRLNDSDEFSVEFPPLGYNPETNTAYVMTAPPGEYTLYMGFQSSNHPFVDIFFHQGGEYIPDDAKPIGVDIQVQAATPWNYDRNNETDPVITDSKGRYVWNGLGGPVGVVNIEGEEMQTFRMKVRFSRVYKADLTYKQMRIFHWALKPTENNY